MTIVKYIKKWLKINILDDIVLLRRNIDKESTVLDLGCGYNSLIQYCDPKYSVGVENFADYIKISKSKKIHNEYIQEDITRLEFPEKSVDIVYCSEVIEHLNKNDGRELLQKMEKWARKKVIITTPNGFVSQDEYHKNPGQKHLSGWDTQELTSLGYRVYGINGIKILTRISDKNIFTRMMYILSGKLFRFSPEYTFQIFALKNFEK